MCQQQNIQNDKSKKMKPTYSIKKVLKILFKKQQQQQQLKNKQQHQQQHLARKCISLESLESLENMRNTQMEEHFYEEIVENVANEKLAYMNTESFGNTTRTDNEQSELEQDIYVPVRFARTHAGTFFWTTNLQPVASTITPTVAEDLLQPAYCYSSQYQWPYAYHYQDRWAQA